MLANRSPIMRVCSASPGTTRYDGGISSTPMASRTSGSLAKICLNSSNASGLLT